MRITMKKGWEGALRKQIVNSPEWKRQERAVNDEIDSVHASMAGRPARDVRAALLRKLPFLKASGNVDLLAQLVEEISS